MAIALALAAAASWGLADFLAGLASRRVSVPIVLLLVEGCGLVVPPNDVPALAEAIATLADNRALRLELGAAGRARCVSTYSDDAVRPRLLRVLNDAMGDRQSRTAAEVAAVAR